MESKLIVITGLTCAGKTTLANQLKEELNLSRIVTCTTRKQREGEVDGVDYHFMNIIGFNKILSNGEIIEYTEINNNGRVDYYGTPKSEVLKEGTKIIVLDLYGTVTFKKMFPNNTLTMYIDADKEVRRMRAVEGRGWSEYKWQERCKSDEYIPENIKDYIDVVIDGNNNPYSQALDFVTNYVK